MRLFICLFNLSSRICIVKCCREIFKFFCCFICVQTIFWILKNHCMFGCSTTSIIILSRYFVKDFSHPIVAHNCNIKKLDICIRELSRLDQNYCEEATSKNELQADHKFISTFQLKPHQENRINTCCHVNVRKDKFSA